MMVKKSIGNKACLSKIYYVCGSIAGSRPLNKTLIAHIGGGAATLNPMWAFLFKMAKTYYEKLKDPRWQRKRLEVMERDEWKCRRCKCEGKTLNVHHKRYAKNGDPWGVELKDLVTLCEHCHEVIELNKKSVLECLINNDYFIDFDIYETNFVSFMENLRCNANLIPIIEQMFSAFDDERCDSYAVGRSEGIHWAKGD